MMKAKNTKSLQKCPASHQPNSNVKAPSRWHHVLIDRVPCLILAALCCEDQLSPLLDITPKKNCYQFQLHGLININISLLCRQHNMAVRYTHTGHVFTFKGEKK
ncbi:hypothetical protein AMECASPLE_010154 [Ameca splendens]|uniref:Uncharacterized protein n=1 Tax=Ameca splendens TaxID=208324 RepID=A0ABV0ZK57_9TELE